MIDQELHVGAAVVEITPPLEVGLLTSAVKGTYAPFESVRLPLKARVIVWQAKNEATALVALDLMTLNDTAVGGWENFKQQMKGRLPINKLMLTCTHTHSAPESVALSNLYLTAAFKDWLRQIQSRIGQALAEALANLRPATVSVGFGVLNGYSLQRRIPTDEGIVMSDTLQPIDAALMKREPVDRRVGVLRFSAGNTVLATMVRAVCHPVHEMCLPHISAEFPGELCLALEEKGGFGVPLFVNGAAGDINPPTVSGGAAYARAHGRALAQVVSAVSYTPVSTANFAILTREIPLAVRPEAGMDNPADAVARIHALCIGDLALIFLPGEPFSVTALKIEEASPFQTTIVMAYGENNIGYIPPLDAIKQGGYEAGPGKWSFLAAENEARLIDEALALLQTLYDK